MEHSPTPYKAVKSPNWYIVPDDAKENKMGLFDSGLYLAEAYYRPLRGTEEGNADFIVKSCNIIGHLESKGLIDLNKVTPEAMEEVIMQTIQVFNSRSTFNDNHAHVSKSQLYLLGEALSKLK